MQFTPIVTKSSTADSIHTRSFNYVKQPLVAIALLACSVSLLGCSNTPIATQAPVVASSPVASVPSSQPEPVASSPIAQQRPRVQKPPVVQNPDEPVTDLEPEIGIIRRIQQGDLMCYITFTDDGGQERTEGATFELCEQPQQYLNQRVRLVYGVRNVSDCSSNEPCGKSRRANVVVQLHRVDAAGRPLPNDETVLRNGEWTIAIGNRNSWSGVNGTGNLTYRGCNSRQECLELTDGKVTCRDGMCATVWRNGSYTYTLTSPISESPTGSTSTLIVAKDGKELQRISNLQ